MANSAPDPVWYILLPDRINQGYGLVQSQYTDLDRNTSPLAILHDPYNSLAIVYSDTLAGYSTALNTLESDMAQYDDQGRPTYDHPDQALYASFARQEIDKARPVHSNFFSAQTGQSLDHATWAYKSYDQFAKLQGQLDAAPEDFKFITPLTYTFVYPENDHTYLFKLNFPTPDESRFIVTVPKNYWARYAWSRANNPQEATTKMSDLRVYIENMNFAAQTHPEYVSGWRDAFTRQGSTIVQGV